ncbi:type II pantothenate kinase [Lysinibacillus odysseyi]|uniref:Pantothenate kinase n=1 Tax=Lysinibacillus odysseyi 34hs-1 = NBRC 100172 TaxID=1220589 RepID=A0A0A3J3U6_9BACI|nr:type II pantothenate kinase [Lysinibacillus odysseyi]KGR81717.1 pantothenate kinase [Lysinibacillus odysseyi 34hs-1 = NBRC 100172]
MAKALGIDTGGTLTKLAYINQQGELTLEVFPSNEMERVKEWLERHPQVDEIGVTGGRTEQLRSVLQTMKSIEYIVEFEATLKGVRYLLEKEGHQIDKCIITNIGTGTSIHYMDGKTHSRISGTGIGGGTLVGLAGLLTGITDFEKITSLAAKGDRSAIDLLVKDIFQGMESPIDGSLTASNFGKVGITEAVEHPIENVLATVQGLVGEVITTLSIQLAEERNAKYIVYIGSTLTDNENLKKVISHYTILKKHTPVFLEDSGFSGAVGALLNITGH